jgi:hypothetical protein
MQGIRMRERAYNFSAYFDGVHTPYCTNDRLYRHATRRILYPRVTESRVTEIQTAYEPQREILRMRPFYIFAQNYLAMIYYSNTADVTGGKPIAV